MFSHLKFLFIPVLAITFFLTNLTGVDSERKVASAESNNSHLTVCVNKETGRMRVPKMTSRQNCWRNEVRLIWNQQGRIGEIGQAGAVGSSGSVGPTGDSGNPGRSIQFPIVLLSVCGVSGTELCKHGSRGPGGGLVFFIDYWDQYSGFDYLEAAPESCEGISKSWSSDTSNSRSGISGWISRSVGLGQSNTNSMLSNSGSYVADTSGSAKYADTLICGGKSDWFVGTVGETKLMFSNLIGYRDFSLPFYWTSSEAGGTSAWALDTILGSVSAEGKNQLLGVLPIRAF